MTEKCAYMYTLIYVTEYLKKRTQVRVIPLGRETMYQRQRQER